MEIAPQIHLIPGTIGAKPLQLFMLRGETRVVLLDTGTAVEPERLIFPYLESVGLAATDVDLVINTHADADHVGGNAAFKRAAPQAALTCGEADRAWIQDPARMLD
jgi:glyoxylase-like metal-dependent hydrolase (beta-lactamase superfamily II)